LFAIVVLLFALVLKLVWNGADLLVAIVALVGLVFGFYGFHTSEIHDEH
jgi:ABC-type nickel/cobalt efflux system permease component RcnA